MPIPTPETTRLEIRISRKGIANLYHDGRYVPTTGIIIDGLGKVTVTIPTRFVKVTHNVEGK